MAAGVPAATLTHRRHVPSAHTLQVLATNEAVFGAIATAFQSLLAAVLPAYRVRLRKVGAASAGQGGATAVWCAMCTGQLRLCRAPCPSRSQVGEAVHEGVQLEFAHRGGSSGGSRTDEAQGDGAGWRSGLDVLSGGQRTLVSLTFVVAVGGRGGVR